VLFASTLAEVDIASISYQNSRVSKYFWRKIMKKQLIAGLLAGAVVTAVGVSHADERGAPDWTDVEQFAVLPDGVRFPEGITANPATGEIYAGTFDFGPNANKLIRFDKHGHVVAQRDFGGTPLLGLEFDSAHNKVFILNFGGSKVQRIAADFTSTTAVEDVATLPSIGPPSPRSVPNPDGSSDTITFGASKAAPNGMVFDVAGNLYVSDSFQGAIFRIDNAKTCAPPCLVTTVLHDPLLATAGFPPFGANGLALNGDQTVLFIANTGDNHVLQMNVASKALTVFAESVHGADGLLFDAKSGLLWVAANQADELVALNSKGRVVARAGEFQGIEHDGTPRGLLFPASMVVVGEHMYVTNLALPLTPAVGDEPEEDVTRWTIARFKVPKR
jgi:DNA-binding beta-propeller fold protein YncE